jgi:hypothetical protein
MNAARPSLSVHRWLVEERQRLHDGLCEILDVETGLREVTIDAHRARLNSDLRSVLDLEGGLAAILPSAEPAPASADENPSAWPSAPNADAGDLTHRINDIDPQARLTVRTHPRVRAFARDLDRAVALVRDLDEALELGEKNYDYFFMRALSNAGGLFPNLNRHLELVSRDSVGVT